MGISSITLFCVIVLLAACSDSSDYHIPPDYHYDEPSRTSEKEERSSSRMLDIALSMRDGSQEDSQSSRENAPSVKATSSAITADSGSTLAKSKPAGSKETPSQHPAPAATVATKTNTGLKELDFSANQVTEKKITTIALNNGDEFTHSKAQQASLYAISERGRFYKTDKWGRTLDMKSESWFCVKDNKNRLLWEAKTGGQSRNMQHTYSLEGKNGRCQQAPCNPEAYIAYLNEIKLCGRNNWRLPSKIELTSLGNQQHDENQPATDTRFFPNTQMSSYWSATPFEYAENRAWAVDFTTGFGKSHAKTEAYHLRLVSSH